MPKIKTRRSAAKRFSLTGSGKFKRRRQNMRHILTKKAPGRKMRLGQSAIVDSANEKAVRRMLPNGLWAHAAWRVTVGGKAHVRQRRVWSRDQSSIRIPLRRADSFMPYAPFQASLRLPGARRIRSCV